MEVNGLKTVFINLINKNLSIANHYREILWFCVKIMDANVCNLTLLYHFTDTSNTTQRDLQLRLLLFSELFLGKLQGVQIVVHTL